MTLLFLKPYRHLILFLALYFVHIDKVSHDLFTFKVKVSIKKFFFIHIN